MNYATTTAVLKPLDELTLPDPRFEILVVENPTGLRPFDIPDLHKRLCLSKLNPEVPKDVQAQFQTALNLMLYAWFVFEFQTTAEAQAYAALEFALQTRFPKATKKIKKGKFEKIVPWTFGPLLRLAVDQRAIVADELPAWERVKANRPFYEQQSPFPLAPLPTPAQWLDGVVESIPDFRNELAHGQPKLYLHGSFFALELCADLINALFPKADEKSETASK